MAGRHRRVRTSGQGRHRQPPRRGHVVLPSLAVAAVLGIGGVGAGAALSGSDHASPVTPVPQASALGTAPTTTPTPSATPSPTAAPTQGIVNAAVLPDFAITVTGRASWVEVVGPRGKVMYAGLLRHGHTLSYRQRPLLVTLGDAGAVRLVLHHHARAHAGKRGQVLRFTVR